MINPKYTIELKPFPLLLFYRRQEFAKPNYQSTEWSIKQQQNFINNAVRGTYSSPIVLRSIYQPNKKSPIWEVLDGWQRIKAIQNTMRSEIPFHPSLKNILSFEVDITDNSNMLMCFLKSEAEVLVGQQVTTNTNIIKGIENIKNRTYQKLTQDIIKQLQRHKTKTH
jgi:hypothetical protein